MEKVAGSVLVGVGGLTVVGALGGLLLAAFVPSSVPDAGAARASLAITSLVSGAIGGAMVWGGVALIGE
jgi:hypothetical protein